MNKFFIIILLTISFLSCKKEYPEKLNLINNLDIKLKKADSTLNLVSPIEIDKKFNIYTLNQEDLSKSVDDTLTDDVFYTLTTYKDFKKPFSSFRTKHNSYKKEIESLLNQISNLKHDITLNLIEEKDMDIAIKDESEDIEKIIFMVEKDVSQIIDLSKKFDSINPIIEKRIALWKADTLK